MANRDNYINPHSGLCQREVRGVAQTLTITPIDFDYDTLPEDKKNRVMSCYGRILEPKIRFTLVVGGERAYFNMDPVDYYAFALAPPYYANPAYAGIVKNINNPRTLEKTEVFPLQIKTIKAEICKEGVNKGKSRIRCMSIIRTGGYNDKNGKAMLSKSPWMISIRNGWCTPLEGNGVGYKKGSDVWEESLTMNLSDIEMNRIVRETDELLLVAKEKAYLNHSTNWGKSYRNFLDSRKNADKKSAEYNNAGSTTNDQTNAPLRIKCFVTAHQPQSDGTSLFLPVQCTKKSGEEIQLNIYFNNVDEIKQVANDGILRQGDCEIPIKKVGDKFYFTVS